MFRLKDENALYLLEVKIWHLMARVVYLTRQGDKLQLTIRFETNQTMMSTHVTCIECYNQLSKH